MYPERNNFRLIQASVGHSERNGMSEPVKLYKDKIHYPKRELTDPQACLEPVLLSR